MNISGGASEEAQERKKTEHAAKNPAVQKTVRKFRFLYLYILFPFCKNHSPYFDGMNPAAAERYVQRNGGSRLCLKRRAYSLRSFGAVFRN